jgi:predicted GNAT family acetyltransferase
VKPAVILVGCKLGKPYENYAGSVTAATVDRIYAEGRKIACLYADLRNPASNRCYTKIGFTPVCTSLHFHREVV